MTWSRPRCSSIIRQLHVCIPVESVADCTLRSTDCWQGSSPCPLYQCTTFHLSLCGVAVITDHPVRVRTVPQSPLDREVHSTAERTGNRWHQKHFHWHLVFNKYNSCHQSLMMMPSIMSAKVSSQVESFLFSLRSR